MEKTLVSCTNCGAQTDKNSPKCPYCGYINESSSELKYMEALDDIRQKLDVVDDAAAAEYRKGYRSTVRLIFITLAVLLLLTGVWFSASRFPALRHKSSDAGSANAVLAEMTWKQEAYSYFDKLYEDGKYEQLCDAVFGEYSERHNVSDWTHYGFARMYDSYLSTESIINDIDSQGWHSYNAATVFYNCCCFYYMDEYSSPFEMDEEDVAELESAAGYMNEILHERLMYTDEDMAAMRSSILQDNGVIMFDACHDIALKDMEKYRE